MAKLGKIKLNLIGEVSGRTTYKGDIELYLYYDVDQNHFYFEMEDLKKIFKEDVYFNFGGCTTKEMAINLIREYLIGSTEKKKMLQLKIKVTADLGKGKKEFPAYLEGNCRIFKKEGYEDNVDLEIGFKKIMRLGSDESQYLYVDCDDNWNYQKSGFYYGHNASSLIEWDEETELFLVNMQKQMNNMCKSVVDFFNAPNEKELKQRISNSPLMIGQK